MKDIWKYHSIYWDSIQGLKNGCGGGGGGEGCERHQCLSHGGSLFSLVSMLYSFPVPCLLLHLLTNNSNFAQKNKKNNHSGGGPSSGKTINLVMFVLISEFMNFIPVLCESTFS